MFKHPRSKKDPEPWGLEGLFLLVSPWVLKIATGFFKRFQDSPQPAPGTATRH